MAQPPSLRPPPRARPVADAPLPRTGEQIEAIAQRWALALLAERPLAAAPELPLEELAARAPALCEQILRALGSQAELDRLLGLPVPGSRQQPRDFGADLIACAGAGLPGEAIQALEALRGELWEAIEGELGRGAPDARLTGQLADRLAHLCSALLAQAIAALPAEAPSQGLQEPPPPAAGGGGGGGIVILDERLSGASAPAPEPTSRPERLSAPESRPATEPRSAYESRPERASSGPPERAAEPIEIRDRRHEEGPAAWIGSIGGQLERYEQDGRPFAVLLMDLAAEAAEAGALAQLEAALSAELQQGPAATLTSERPGRHWLVVPNIDPAGADVLAARLQRVLLVAAKRLGAPVTVACGSAICPEDGRSASALAAHADVGLYASRWEARAGRERSESV